ncbi:ABC transporter permease [Roseateles amylovorans]|uniref:ABC transporter permease n=1 Tax=Roseateles amylovorans TaxID=2978473 RepID=A0ABY6AW94_9BURK|nr:ABC transporter permease [Roseateles amylovorans]UXH76952.1 ABC transporter permease [Roseateles amylovorans]
MSKPLNPPSSGMTPEVPASVGASASAAAVADPHIREERVPPTVPAADGPARRRTGPSGRWLLGLALLGGLALFAVLGPWWTGIDPAAQDLRQSLAPPSWAHPLGTDLLGRSVLSRLTHAARLSLLVAVMATLSAALPGVLLGLWAAWRGGTTERAVVMLADAMLALPALLLVLLFAALAPGELWALYAGLSLGLWVEYFRVSRAQARPVLHGPGVEAARLLGLSRWTVWRHHLLPAVWPVVARLLPLSVGQSVLSLSALGFIGVGMPPPTAELGLMMTEYLPHYEEAPWLLPAPIALLLLLVLGLWLVTSSDAAGADPSHDAEARP